ncbi:hypothetical protein NBRC10512_000744 [Rhodotorula toruloides]|uniref:Uncharacterized protein n=1 Tax=Rhodotorula toruloides (strain NP11) TaxID=1130832 RepID=M7XLV8_RHOT1|nr:uncharacterized protein RHTO_02039 [Rhodotorula toruloides NP11]EMS21168.1 hypothetical protein RHTO_02039 [Rhodotorula toruloides NP11]
MQLLRCGAAPPWPPGRRERRACTSRGSPRPIELCDWPNFIASTLCSLLNMAIHADETQRMLDDPDGTYDPGGLDEGTDYDDAFDDAPRPSAQVKEPKPPKERLPGSQGVRNAFNKGAYLPCPPPSLPRHRRARRPKHTEGLFPTTPAHLTFFTPSAYWEYARTTPIEQSQRLGCCSRENSACSRRLALLFAHSKQEWLDSFPLGHERYQIALIPNMKWWRDFEKQRCDGSEVQDAAFPSGDDWDTTTHQHPSVERRLRHWRRIRPNSIILVANATAVSHFRTWSGVLADDLIGTLEGILAAIGDKSKRAELETRVRSIPTDHASLIDYVHTDVTNIGDDPSAPPDQCYLDLLDLFSSGNGKGKQSHTIGPTKPEVGTGFLQGSALLSKPDASSFGTRLRARGIPQERWDNLYSMLQTMTGEVNERVGIIAGYVFRVVLLPEELEALEARHQANGTLTGGDPLNFFTTTLQINHSPLSAPTRPPRHASPTPGSAVDATQPSPDGTDGSPAAATPVDDGRRHLEVTIGVRFGAPHSDHGDEVFGWTLLLDFSKLPPGSHPGCFFDFRLGTFCEFEPYRRLVYFFPGVAPHVGSAPRLPPASYANPSWARSTRSVGVAYPSSMAFLSPPPLATDCRSLHEVFELATSTPSAAPPLLARGEGAASFGSTRNVAYILTLLHAQREVRALVRDYLTRHVVLATLPHPMAPEHLRAWHDWAKNSGHLVKAVQRAEEIDCWNGIVRRKALEHKLDSTRRRSLRTLEEQLHLADSLHLPSHSLHELGAEYLASRGLVRNEKGKAYVRSRIPPLPPLPPALFALSFDIVSPFRGVWDPSEFEGVNFVSSDALKPTKAEEALARQHAIGRPDEWRNAMSWLLGFFRRWSEWTEDEFGARDRFVAAVQEALANGKSLSARDVRLLSQRARGEMAEQVPDTLTIGEQMDFSKVVVQDDQEDDPSFSLGPNGASVPQSALLIIPQPPRPAVVASAKKLNEIAAAEASSGDDSSSSDIDMLDKFDQALLALAASPVASTSASAGAKRLVSPALDEPPAKRTRSSTEPCASAKEVHSLDERTGVKVGVTAEDGGGGEQASERHENEGDEENDGDDEEEENEDEDHPDEADDEGGDQDQDEEDDGHKNGVRRSLRQAAAAKTAPESAHKTAKKPVARDYSSASDEENDIEGGQDDPHAAMIPAGFEKFFSLANGDAPSLVTLGGKHKAKASARIARSAQQKATTAGKEAAQQKSSEGEPPVLDLVRTAADDADEPILRTPADAAAIKQYLSRAITDGVDELDPAHFQTAINNVTSAPVPLEEEHLMILSDDDSSIIALASTLTPSAPRRSRATSLAADLAAASLVARCRLALADAETGRFVAETLWPWILADLDKTRWDELPSGATGDWGAGSQRWERVKGAARDMATRSTMTSSSRRRKVVQDNSGVMALPFLVDSADGQVEYCVLRARGVQVKRGNEGRMRSVVGDILFRFLLAHSVLSPEARLALPAPVGTADRATVLDPAAAVVDKELSLVIKSAFLAATLLHGLQSPCIFLLPPILDIIRFPQSWKTDERAARTHARSALDATTSPAWRHAIAHLSQEQDVLSSIDKLYDALPSSLRQTLAPFQHEPLPSITFPPWRLLQAVTIRPAEPYTFDAFLRQLLVNDSAIARPSIRLNLPAPDERPRISVLKGSWPGRPTKVAKVKAEAEELNYGEEQRWFAFYMREWSIAMGIIPDDSATWCKDVTALEGFRKLVKATPDKFCPFREHVPARRIFNFSQTTPIAQQAISLALGRSCLIGSHPQVLQDIAQSHPNGWATIEEWEEWMARPDVAQAIAEGRLGNSRAYGTAVGQIGFGKTYLKRFADFFRYIPDFVQTLQAAREGDKPAPFLRALDILTKLKKRGSGNKQLVGLQGEIIALVFLGDLSKIGLVAPPSADDIYAAACTFSIGGRAGLARIGFEQAYGSRALGMLHGVLNGAPEDGGPPVEFVQGCAKLGIDLDELVGEHASCKFTRGDLDKVRLDSWWHDAPQLFNLDARVWRLGREAQGGSWPEEEMLVL